MSPAEYLSRHDPGATVFSARRDLDHPFAADGLGDWVDFGLSAEAGRKGQKPGQRQGARAREPSHFAQPFVIDGCKPDRPGAPVKPAHPVPAAPVPRSATRTAVDLFPVVASPGWPCSLRPRQKARPKATRAQRWLQSCSTLTTGQGSSGLGSRVRPEGYGDQGGRKRKGSRNRNEGRLTGWRFNQLGNMLPKHRHPVEPRSCAGHHRAPARMRVTPSFRNRRGGPPMRCGAVAQFSGEIGPPAKGLAVFAKSTAVQSAN